jgi:branched-chain amino acid transport system substrate-binding protein
MTFRLSSRVGRRGVLRAGLALPLAAPPFISARGEVPVKIGFIDPITGSLSALAVSEVAGAKYTVGEINKKGGILGREVQLLVEDSANDVGTGVQKARKLIERDKVDCILGDVNSAIAYAIAGVTSAKKVFHIVPGGHTDPITGTDCKWNVFRVCNTTTMDTAAITETLVKKFGKRFFFITPDYAYGHTLQDGFIKRLKALGGTWEGDMLPIASVDFSATLIKARAFKPDVLLNNMGGAAQVACMKQIVQFGLEKQMALGGALFELESMLSVPADAQRGWWTMEWWWNQPDVPGVKEFVSGMQAAGAKAVTARHWMAFVAVHSVRLAAEKAKSLAGPAMAKALEGMELPPEIAMQPSKVSTAPATIS